MPSVRAAVARPRTLSWVLPLFTCPVSAGFPSAAEGYEDEPLDLHKWLVRNPAATFFFRARGTDEREHIRDGSVLVVDRSINPYAGCLALVEDAGAFAVLRLRDRQLPVRVVGVVTAVVTRL